jgi:hypothetical protein
VRERFNNEAPVRRSSLRWQTEPGSMRLEVWSADEGFTCGVVLDRDTFDRFVRTLSGFGGAGAFELRARAEYGVPKFARRQEVKS